MARHYSTKDFFRQMPNGLLARYFAGKEACGALDFSAKAKAKQGEQFGAWLYLPEPQRNAIEAEFREIFQLGCEKGFIAIRDEAEWHFTVNQNDPEGYRAFVDELAALANHYERAMVTFLDHKAYWKGAMRFRHADTLPYWRKRKNLPHVAAAVDVVSIKALEDKIRAYFHHAEGRGKNCVVEPLRRGDLDYFFAYPEDYSQQSVEWVDGTFDRRPHNPAFEVVFVYSQKEGSLDLNLRGSFKAIVPLQSMFATAILKLPELPPDPKDERVYDLAPLSQKSFNFIPTVGSGIEKVLVKKLRLSSRITKGDRLTVEADPSVNANAVYDLLDEIGKSVPLHQYNVTQVDLTAYVADGDNPAKAVSFRLGHPNSCSLKYDELDLKLRDMLEASGIEPKEPEQASAIATPIAAEA
jgi:hypothetical protein